MRLEVGIPSLGLGRDGNVLIVRDTWGRLMEREVPHLLLQHLQPLLVLLLGVEVVHQLGVGVVGLQYGGHPPGGGVWAGGPVRQVTGAGDAVEVLRGGYELYVGQPREGVDLVQVLDGLHGQAWVEDGGDVGGAM